MTVFKFSKWISIFLVILLSFVLFDLKNNNISFSFFDRRIIFTSHSILTGNWISLNSPANSDNIVTYIEENHWEIDEYLINTIAETTENGEIVLDPIYQNYTYGELRETVNLIRRFSDSFLNYKPNAIAEYPKNPSENSLMLNSFQSLLPGESLQCNQVIQTAQFSEITYYSAITFQITMEARNGEDISDYALEILFDSTPFSNNNPFGYEYRLVDPISWDETRAQNNISPKNNHLVPISGPVKYLTEVYKGKNGSYKSVLYEHTYPKPKGSGSWKRLGIGPNYYIGKPSGSKQGMKQQFQVAKQATREGLLLMGRPDGAKVELRICLPYRNPRFKEIDVMPVQLVLSRGLAVDSSGHPLEVQSDFNVEPIITVKAIAGGVWD